MTAYPMTRSRLHTMFPPSSSAITRDDAGLSTWDDMLAQPDIAANTSGMDEWPDAALSATSSSVGLLEAWIRGALVKAQTVSRIGNYFDIDVERDVAVLMPPKSRFPVTLRVVSVQRGAPLIARDDLPPLDDDA